MYEIVRYKTMVVFRKFLGLVCFTIMFSCNFKADEVISVKHADEAKISWIEVITLNEVLNDMHETSVSSQSQKLNVLACNETIYSTTELNVRSLPSVQSDIVDTVCLGQELKQTGRCDNGWVQILYNDSVAYVIDDYVSNTKPEKVPSADINIETGYSGIICREGNISDSRLNKIECNYNILPQNIRSFLELSGWKYICSDNNFGAPYGYNYSILALTVYDAKIIYIDNRAAAESAILHEAGHAIDSSLSFVSNSAEFNEIFNLERSSFCDFHSTHSNNTATTSEYFAEAFYMCYYSPNEMKVHCPATYNYITNLIH